MQRTLKWFDLITLNSIFTGLSTVAQTFTPLLIPLYVQNAVGLESQGTYFGIIRFFTLMIALFSQATMGAISDSSTFSFGRRRPFILAGSIFAILLIAATGLTPGFEGISGFWYLLIVLLLLMFSLNTSQAGAQGLIPDIVPITQRGRFSAAKAILEIPIPLILVALLTGNLISAGRDGAALLAVILILTTSTLLTMFSPEPTPVRSKFQLKWKIIVRLVVMTLVFLTIIVILGGVLLTLKTFLQNLSLAWSILLFGGLGLIAMLLSIGLGVYFSVKIGLGDEHSGKLKFTWWVINRLAFLAGITNIASFALYYLQIRLGFSGNEAARPVSVFMLIVGTCILLTAAPSGWLSDKIGPLRLVTTSAFLATIGLIIILVTKNLNIIYLGGILVGGATGMFYTSSWSLGTNIVPIESSARYLGISNLAGAGAGALGAFIGGPIADHFTQTAAYIPGLGYTIIFILYGLLFIFSIFAAFRMQKTDHTRAT